MFHTSKFLKAVVLTQQLLNDYVFKCNSRSKSSDFSREGNMLTFKRMILFQLFMVKKFIQIELDDFFKQFDYEDQSVTKQAYSLARKKVLPSTFIHLMKAVLRDFYAGDSFKTFYGYRLCAIDGSVFGLNNTQALRDHFGVAKNQAVSYARSYAACVYDVLNDMILTAQIGSYGSNERTVAKRLIEELKETVGFKNDLIICDRGYPSKDLIAFIEAHHLCYACFTEKHERNHQDNRARSTYPN